MPDNNSFTGHINHLDSSVGANWLRAGIQLFVRQRHGWMMLMLVFFALSLLVLTLPVIGPLLTKIAAPVFTAGIMSCCIKLDQSEGFKLADALRGFQERGAQLVRLGLIYTGLLLLLSYLVVTFFTYNGGREFIEALVGFNQQMLEGNQPELSTLVMPEPMVLFKTAIFWVICYVPIMMLMMFSPILVWRYKRGLIESMRLSFMAIWLNRGAFWRYVLALLVVLAMYIVPLLLAALLLKAFLDSAAVLIATMIFVISALIIKPIIVLSAYEAHKDLFLAKQEYLAA